MNRAFVFCCAALLVAMLAVGNVVFSFIQVPSLGDGGLLVLFLVDRENFPGAKYLASMESMRVIYSAIWGFPPINNLLPEQMASPIGFIRVVGGVVMMIATLLLLIRYKGAYRVCFAIATPIWLLFSFGYVELYPFVSCLYLALLCWLFDGELEQRGDISIGVVCGSIPLVYLGFAPLSVMILTVYLGGGSIERTLKVLSITIFSFAVVLRLFWPDSLSEYFIVLYRDLNLGDTNTVYKAYMGLASSERSIFFKSSYVWSWEHLKELSYMLFYGMGLVPLFVLAFLSARFRSPRLTKSNCLLMLFVLWAIFYFSYTIPKLGPRLDVDMFFISYLTLAFCAGLLIDRGSLNVWVSKALLGGHVLVSLAAFGLLLHSAAA